MISSLNHKKLLLSALFSVMESQPENTEMGRFSIEVSLKILKSGIILKTLYRKVSLWFDSIDYDFRTNLAKY